MACHTPPLIKVKKQDITQPQSHPKNVEFRDGWDPGWVANCISPCTSAFWRGRV